MPTGEPSAAEIPSRSNAGGDGTPVATVSGSTPTAVTPSSPVTSTPSAAPTATPVTSTTTTPSSPVTSTPSAAPTAPPATPTTVPPPASPTSLPQPSPEPSVAPTVVAGNWSGRWETHCGATFRGSLEVHQNEESATGTYAAGEGTVDGDRFIGTWSRNNSIGSFEFFMSEDGSQFAGNFNSDFQWCGFRDSAGLPSPCYRPNDYLPPQRGD